MTTMRSRSVRPLLSMTDRTCLNTFAYASPSYECDKPECKKCGKQPAHDTKYPTEWLLDSGASCHFTSVLDDFIEHEMGNFGYVGTAEAGKVLPITARGTVMFEHEVVNHRTGEVHVLTSTIAPVYYCKGMGISKMSKSYMNFFSLIHVIP
ncbi:hypothetical protein AGABI1DRAFT_134626 [Agaricus bisporus var. burnettii JB137-S8]|uniref:Uncharacterized protein n=1 Tax=Agaricus bisporus var. burnettii (strain JB137-S8 / ATCC MYA-4627 / FGSC 10392) TaxID=597362 RepID=K5XGI8_AGABU|nr:uncharacterized protein AGABI1DRAFT_134626 [Agaricus bisporus var. burnettii JB137-S8]EKM73515.1 hypothetical protein AGABI1DRAFT_134626 [Agaricus bisporus var. burnettii JB137-S8]